MRTPTTLGPFSLVPRSMAGRSAAAHAVGGSGRALVHVLAGLLLVAGGSAAAAPQAVLAGSSAYDHDSQVMSANQPDWMAQLPDSTPLGRMSIPGTHDSMAIHGGIAYQAQSLCGTGASADSSNTSPCDPTAQLNAGIRFLDIRLKCTGLDTKALGVYHGSGDAGDQHADFSSNVLAKVQQFLTSHPSETVLLEVSNEGDDLYNSCAYNPNPSTYASPFEYQFSQDVANYPNLLWKPPCPPYCSTQPAGVSSYSISLGEARGHVVLLPRFTTKDQFKWGVPWNGYSSPAGISGSGFDPLVIQDNYDVCEVVVAGCPEDFNQKVTDVEAQAKTASTGDTSHLYVNFLSGSTHAIPYRVRAASRAGLPKTASTRRSSAGCNRPRRTAWCRSGSRPWTSRAST